MTGSPRHTLPNNGLEPTGNSVRSFVAPTIPSGSGPAFGSRIHTTRVA
jgi:hypothetical protein